MGQTLSYKSIDDRKAYEYTVFESSFELIEKYVKNTKGFLNAYQREYRRAQKKSKGYLNWHNVMPRQLKGVKGMAYLEAINTVAKLLHKAEDICIKSQNGLEKQKFREIYEFIDLLIDLRENELSPEFQCLCFQTKGEVYEKHECVINAWRQFRSGQD